MAIRKATKKRNAVKRVCRKVKLKATRRTKTVCKPKKKRPVKRKVVVAVPKPPAAVVTLPAVTGGGSVLEPSPAAPPVTRPPAPGPPPPEQPPPTAPGLPVYGETFGVAQAQRLLWRTGFGPRPGEAEGLRRPRRRRAVRSLTRPNGGPTLTGAAPTVNGLPIAPDDAWGHDHLWWMDRMIRSDQPLVERMTLIWARLAGDDERRRRQPPAHARPDELFRRHALGSFADLITDVTAGGPTGATR